MDEDTKQDQENESLTLHDCTTINVDALIAGTASSS